MPQDGAGHAVRNAGFDRVTVACVNSLEMLPGRLSRSADAMGPPNVLAVRPQGDALIDSARDEARSRSAKAVGLERSTGAVQARIGFQEAMLLVEIRTRTNSACRRVPVLSKMRARCVRAVAREIESRSAAA